MSYTNRSIHSVFGPTGTSTNHAIKSITAPFIVSFLNIFAGFLADAGWGVGIVPPIAIMNWGTPDSASFFMQHQFNNTPSFWGITDPNSGYKALAIDQVPSGFTNPFTCGTTGDDIMQCCDGFTANCAGEGSWNRVVCGTGTEPILQILKFMYPGIVFQNIPGSTNTATQVAIFPTVVNGQPTIDFDPPVFGAALHCSMGDIIWGGFVAETAPAQDNRNIIQVYMALGHLLTFNFEATIALGTDFKSGTPADVAATLCGDSNSGTSAGLDAVNHPFYLEEVTSGTGTSTGGKRTAFGCLDGWEFGLDAFANPHQVNCVTTLTTTRRDHLDACAGRLLNLQQDDSIPLTACTFGVVGQIAFSTPGFFNSASAVGIARYEISDFSPFYLNGGTVELASLQAGKYNISTNGVNWFTGGANPFPLSEPWVAFNPVNGTGSRPVLTQMWDSICINLRDSSPDLTTWEWDTKADWRNYTTNGGLGSGAEGAVTLAFPIDLT